MFPADLLPQDILNILYVNKHFYILSLNIILTYIVMYTN